MLRLRRLGIRRREGMEGEREGKLRYCLKEYSVYLKVVKPPSVYNSARLNERHVHFDFMIPNERYAIFACY